MKQQERRCRTVAGAVWLALCCAPLAGAQSTAPNPANSPGDSHERANAPSYDELARKLEERDAVIQELLRRVEALEQRATAQAGARPAPPTAPAQAPSPPATDQPPIQATARPEQDPSLRALERTLVEQGGLLVPRGAFEIEPGITYTYAQSHGLEIVQSGASNVVTNVSRRTGLVEPAVTLRLGLPHAFQAEVKVPYVYDTQRSAVGGTDEGRSGSGLGDIELAFSKQWVAEGVRRPGLLTTVDWKTRSGHFVNDLTSNSISRGTGFNAIQSRLIAVKTQDPLAFFGDVSYTFNLPSNQLGMRLDPGNAIGFRLGMIFAASPEASLRATYEHELFRQTRANGQSIPGSDFTTGILEVGATMALSPTALLNVGLGFGITDRSPDLRLMVTLPIRFQ